MTDGQHDENSVFWEPSPADYERCAEQANQERKTERLSTMIYDPGSGTRMTLGNFERTYGTERFSEELLEAAKSKTKLPTTTYHGIKSLSARKAKQLTVAKMPIQKNTKDANPGQFLKVDYGFVDRIRTAGCHHNPTGLLMISS